MQTSPLALERELPMLAGIGAFITWCEDLLGLLSGPILTAGLAIALIDLLSNNALFTRVPTLLWVWACSMALGLDAQFIGSAAKAAKAIRQRHPWAATGYFILCGALGYVGFIASNVLATQEANGITTAEALSRLGLDSTNWIIQRSVLAVVLVFLSGFLRYVAPATSAAADTAKERERIQADLELEPLRAQRDAARLRRLRGAAAAAFGREQQQPAGQAVKPRMVVASSTLADSQPVKHTAQAHAPAHANNAMHDWWPEELSDEVDGDDDPNETTFIPSVSRPRDPRMNRAYDDAQRRTDSARVNPYDEGDFDPFDEAEDEEDDYPSNSAHQRKKVKTARGRGNQRQVKASLAVRTQSDRERQRAIRQAVWAVADRIEASGKSFPSEDKLVADVNDHLKAQGSEVRTSRTAVRSWMKGWRNQRRHEQRQTEIAPMEPDELRELALQEVGW